MANGGHWRSEQIELSRNLQDEQPLYPEAAVVTYLQRFAFECRALQKRTQASCSEPAPSAWDHCRNVQNCWGSG